MIHEPERQALDGNLDEARRRNVEPVARLIEALRADPAMRLTFVSTTCVAGNKKGLFTEFDHDCGQRFYNAYDRSLFEAEGLLRASDVRSRVTIVRRCFLLDDGPLASLTAMLAGRRPVVIAADPRAELHAITSAEFAEALASIAANPAAMGKTLHVVTGFSPSRRAEARPTSIRELVDAARRGPVWFLPPALAPLAWALRALTLGFVRAFPAPGSGLGPYLRHRTAFDDFQARQLVT
ncbi:MAG TPA: SDR family oxidoreductase [Thermoanaerobaculia bacterium]|nr:SDR family oxidoreductase [Thermoanaerobaculia bacterium]